MNSLLKCGRTPAALVSQRGRAAVDRVHSIVLLVKCDELFIFDVDVGNREGLYTPTLSHVSAQRRLADHLHAGQLLF